MPRPGRVLEQVVAHLEALVQQADRGGLVVSSPARWKDPTTGEAREIDVSIGAPGAPPEQCVMVEVRDKKKPQDSMWIEQLEGKKKTFNPLRTIAVSRRGFSAPAATKAAAWGIELRLFRDLTIEALTDWFRGGPMVVVNQCIRVDVEYVELMGKVAALPSLGTYADGRIQVSRDAVRLLDREGKEVPWRELGYKLPPEILADVWGQLTPGEGSIAINARMEVKDGDLMLSTEKGVFPVAWMQLKVTFWKEQHFAKISGTTAYGSKAQDLAETVTFSHDWEPAPMKFHLSRTSVPDVEGMHYLALRAESGPRAETAEPPAPVRRYEPSPGVGRPPSPFSASNGE